MHLPHRRLHPYSCRAAATAAAVTFYSASGVVSMYVTFASIDSGRDTTIRRTIIAVAAVTVIDIRAASSSDGICCCRQRPFMPIMQISYARRRCRTFLLITVIR